MKLAISYRSKKRLFWGLAHAWAGIRLRRRFVTLGCIFGLIVAGCISLLQQRVYSSRVVIDSGIMACEHGWAFAPQEPLPNPGPGFGVSYDCPPCRLNALSTTTRILRWVDDTARSVGISKLNLEQRVDDYRRAWNRE